MNPQPLLNGYSSSNVNVAPTSHQEILVPQGTRQIVIPVQRLLCMEGCGNYTYLYTTDGKRYLSSKTLKGYAALLNEATFLRVHKSWIINLEHFQGFCECERSVRLAGGIEIAVSRRKLHEVALVLAAQPKGKTAMKALA
ncbi:MAG: LytR/AlgR family response regulator transcription factor [Runella sp.]